jgi:hypothetical protein
VQQNHEGMNATRGIRIYGAIATIALVVLLAAPAVARGQEILGGISLGNVSNSGILPGNDQQRTGFALGLGANSGGVVGFGFNVLYAQRGITSSTPGDSRQLDYIDVPVFLRLTMPNPVVTPFAYVGPQGSYELNCDAGGGDNCPNTDRPKLTYAGVIGAGVKFHQLAGFSIEGRYVYGLTNLNLNTVSTSQSYQTRSFLVLLGLGL